MTDKELKSLSRRELLEMLIVQMEENERLNSRLAEAERELNDRRIKIEESGSIAEAALRLNNIFSQAENAAGLYLENIQKAEREAVEKAEKLVKDAEAKSRWIVARAENMLVAAEKMRKVMGADKEDCFESDSVNDDVKLEEKKE